MKLYNCYICKTLNYKPYVTIKDSLNISSFTIARCDCGFCFVHPRPSEQELNKYYSTDDYLPHSKGKGLLFLLYRIVQKITFYNKFILLRKSIKEKITHLDYGGGDGRFSNYVNSKKNATSSFYDPYYKKSSNIDLKKNKYNIITLWHVLEHAYDLDVLFQNLEKKLDNRGKLIVAVPNFDSLERNIYKENWAAYDLPRHLYHFNNISLDKLLRSKGYKIIDKKRMLFDTFYISILSSMKISNISIIKSLFVAFFIVIKVLIKGPEFSSSLLYVCEKEK
mgnify:CR=1 FL=1|tara:strand:- start:1745 stop:2581 length:837 start_codon:yes stop_codon:yes gene_type:complete